MKALQSCLKLRPMLQPRERRFFKRRLLFPPCDVIMWIVLAKEFFMKNSGHGHGDLPGDEVYSRMDLV